MIVFGVGETFEQLRTTFLLELNCTDVLYHAVWHGTNRFVVAIANILLHLLAHLFLTLLVVLHLNRYAAWIY